MKTILKTNTNKISGFTLMEMMIVIAIIGILGAIALPAVLHPENRIKKAAKTLYNDIHTTRMGAIKNNADLAIVFEPLSDRYVICRDSGADGFWFTTADNDKIETKRFVGYDAGVAYGHGSATRNAMSGDATFPDDDVSYDSNVLLVNSNGICSAGYVYLEYGGTAYTVGTLGSGIIRIKRWTGGSWK